MLIAMAGLPGTGKSTLAMALERELDAIVLDKDRVRGVLFPTRVLTYSSQQDDVAMAAIFQATTTILALPSAPAVILDGRTFLRAGQILALLAFANSVGESVKVIECVCDDAVLRNRLVRDQISGHHPARNRTFALVESLRATAVPIVLPHLVLDTGRLALDECVRQCREYLRFPGLEESEG